MARPRTPSKVLALRGAFDHDPQRRRRDAEGAGPFEHAPPSHLPREVVPAWAYLVERLPRIALSSSDEIAVELTARMLAQMWACPHDRGARQDLMTLLGKLGLTPTDRAKLPLAEQKPRNQFDKFKTFSESKRQG